MKKLMTLAVAIMLLTFAATAFAQPEDRDVGIYADRDGTSSQIVGPAFVPFFFYVAGWNLDGQVKGFEFELTISDPLLTVLARTFDGPWLNVGSGDNFIVGTGGCLNADGVSFTLVCYQAGLFVPVAPSDVLVCIGPSTPSSFLPETPGYLQCDGSLVPFGIAQNGLGVIPDGCGVINGTDPQVPVATTQESFGAVKAKF